MQSESPTVWLARHGNRQDFVDPDWPKSAARPFDPGLSPDGVEQARRLGARLRGAGITHLFASPYLRTVETASQVADVLDLPIHLEPGIGEWLNPAWFPHEPERLTVDLLAELFPRIDRAYAPRLVPAYPETEAEALARAGKAARRLVEAYPGATLLLVGHGASVAGAVRGLLPEVEITDCALCSLFRLVRSGDGWYMDLCADVSHLG